MNNVNLIGRLTRDPELKEVRGGQSVCQLRIAVDNPGRGAEKGEPTYVDVATFGAQAGACATDLAKGRQVAVSGRLVFREWTGRDGQKRDSIGQDSRSPRAPAAAGAHDRTRERSQRVASHLISLLGLTGLPPNPPCFFPGGLGSLARSLTSSLPANPADAITVDKQKRSCQAGYVTNVRGRLSERGAQTVGFTYVEPKAAAAWGEGSPERDSNS